MTAGLFLIGGNFFFSSPEAQGLVRFQDKRDKALFEGSTHTRSPLTSGVQQWEGLLHVAAAQWQFPGVWI